MHSLWIDGTLMDGTGPLVLALSQESILLVALFYIFLMLSALTVMNMLIGVLCEVVSAVAATEKEALTVGWVKSKLHDIMAGTGLDANGDGAISKRELSELLKHTEACKALSDVGVDVCMLVDNIDFIFAKDEVEDDHGVEKVLTFEDLMELVLDLRGTNTATVKDIVELQKVIKSSNNRLREELGLTRKKPLLRRTAVQKTASEDIEDVRPESPVQREGETRSGSKETDISALVEDLRSEIKRLIVDDVIPKLSELHTSIQNNCCAELKHLGEQVRMDVMTLSAKVRCQEQSSLSFWPLQETDQAESRLSPIRHKLVEAHMPGQMEMVCPELAVPKEDGGRTTGSAMHVTALQARELVSRPNRMGPPEVCNSKGTEVPETLT